ncbi:MAG: MFS transporter [Limnochordia bacterium]|nr:MFS transporter [Limnochordia bacterium]
MTTLLVIIYIAFISLGLPDSVLGSAWPVIRMDLSAPVSLVGYVAMTVSAGTVISSLLSHRMVARFGTAKVTVVSVAMTALALLGYSFVGETGYLFLLAIPLGLGAGSVDAALNNFIALHYKSMHMNWLHCFWGVGATAGPLIMSLFVANQGGWRTGYLVIAALQFALVAVLLVTMKLWEGKDLGAPKGENGDHKVLSNRKALALPSVKLALVSFIFFSVTETTTGLWSSSYLVGIEGMAAATAARWTASFYAGITLGRLLSGFLSIRLKSSVLIRTGQLVCVIGTLLLILPLPATVSALGFVAIGLGTAPIFPAMLHETPHRFGSEASGAIMGLQMAVAYSGGTFGSPLFGALASLTSLTLLPYFLLAAVLVMLIASEMLNKRMAGRTKMT